LLESCYGYVHDKNEKVSILEFFGGLGPNTKKQLFLTQLLLSNLSSGKKLTKNKKIACCQGEIAIAMENQRKTRLFLVFGCFTTLKQPKNAVLHAQIP